jgi:hypothetical protein
MTIFDGLLTRKNKQLTTRTGVMSTESSLDLSRDPGRSRCAIHRELAVVERHLCCVAVFAASSGFREFFKFQCKKIPDCVFKNERSVLYVARRSDAQEEKKGDQAGGS